MVFSGTKVLFKIIGPPGSIFTYFAGEEGVVMRRRLAVGCMFGGKNMPGPVMGAVCSVVAHRTIELHLLSLG